MVDPGDRIPLLKPPLATPEMRAQFIYQTHHYLPLGGLVSHLEGTVNCLFWV